MTVVWLDMKPTVRRRVRGGKKGALGKAHGASPATNQYSLIGLISSSSCGSPQAVIGQGILSPDSDVFITLSPSKNVNHQHASAPWQLPRWYAAERGLAVDALGDLMNVFWKEDTQAENDSDGPKHKNVLCQIASPKPSAFQPQCLWLRL